MQLSRLRPSVFAIAALGWLMSSPAPGQTERTRPLPTAAETTLIAKARGIHDRALTLDTHNDINVNNFGFSRNYTQDLGNQVNLPKMNKGGLDASFFIVYVGQSSADDGFEASGYQRAYDEALSKFEAIHRLTRVLAGDQIELARTVADARRIHALGKKVALIGIENAYPLGDERTAVARVKEFYERGGRYMSLAHNGHSQLSDSNTGETTGWKWNGLSPLGKEVIVEMNRQGMMIDVSHPSKESMMQTLQITKAPIIASHSAVRALADVSRNLDDEQLMALKANGGVIQVVAFASYVKTDSAERRDAIKALREEFKLPPGTNLSPRRGGPGGGVGRGTGGAGRGPNPLAALGDEQRAALEKRVAELDARLPPPARATVKDFVDHIDYAVKKIGIDHVGISSDFDGGGGVDGWNGADETFNVTLELVRRGYTEAQIDQMWSGNLLRVMDEVQKVAKGLLAAAK
ncbi:MAG: membrane dipeptidase [Vicinamibacteria bacterium]|nr:membrane dipeptidase [Vicinamibacteria bacterium]